MLIHTIAVLCTSAVGTAAKQLWSTEPADMSHVEMTAYPLGNGKQGAMPLGVAGKDIVYLNHDSLWSGGPFANKNYVGGNPKSSLAEHLPGIRESIFKDGTGDESALYGSTDNYGTYEILGNLTVGIAGTEKVTSYRRSLDLDTAIHEVKYKSNGVDLTTIQFCSYPAKVCVYYIESSNALPDVTVGLQDLARTAPASKVSCSSAGIRLHGQTQTDPDERDIGMLFDAHVQAVTPSKITCNPSNEIVVSGNTAKSLLLLVGTGTNYDQTKGSSADKYSFKGPDPYPNVLSTVQAASKDSYESLRKSHITDHQSSMHKFTLDLPDPKKSAEVDTTTLINGYSTEEGDPFVESLIIDYAKYLFIASSRPGSLPPNLQGNWAPNMAPPWSADYHINVNLQMNHWHTEMMGLGDLMGPLWDHMKNTWVPRGTESAKLFYGADGWVTHTNLNIFGHTAQENDASWSNYPVSTAWMMKHVWDRYDYSRDLEWYRSSGYPMIKGVAQYWLSMLTSDEYFKDGSLVAVPCNSPEHGPTTFACAHWQQLIWELFDHIIRDWEASGDKDESFLQSVKKAYQSIDSGVHVGSWGQIKEWKLERDHKNDTHRHLSELYGWYPGYAISGVHADNQTVIDAVTTTLYSRGNGTEDSNTGWEKFTKNSYMELKYSIDMNFAPNGLSGSTSSTPPFDLSTPFQIDANFGIAGAALAMLATDIPQAFGDTSTHRVILGPAIPSAWGLGSVKGLKLRGGGRVAFKWDSNGKVTEATVDGRSLPLVVFDREGKVLAKQ
ncbi:Six-hairpin glycosidase [Penicillium concentricum]|uniref:Six-hairpin glycosidase n=1 Tax=Penicillium concentricum TaxID=293559 RepID=A0A9W9V8W1_9EURO|nr:Six-hairpin glycosidase [Penicillium concentricum]KAJ5371889.1 Six-hairpin glycosidase [Penicillium concentricum]